MSQKPKAPPRKRENNAKQRPPAPRQEQGSPSVAEPIIEQGMEQGVEQARQALSDVPPAADANIPPVQAAFASPSSGMDKNTADAHAKAVSDMFSRMTPWYDFQNHAFSLGMDFWWRYNLTRSVVPGPTGVVIDLAAGTLDVTLALCRRYPELHVVAVDICESMLDYGMKRKARPDEVPRITPMVEDARSLPLPNNSADAVTMAFGIRNVLPREDALAEMHRVLVPGGRACILEFAPVTVPVLGPAYHWYLQHVMPKLAGWCSGQPEAYHYFAESVARFPSPAEFSKELKQAGFPFVQYRSFSLGIANLHVAVKG